MDTLMDSYKQHQEHESESQHAPGEGETRQRFWLPTSSIFNGRGTMFNFNVLISHFKSAWACDKSVFISCVSFR